MIESIPPAVNPAKRKKKVNNTIYRNSKEKAHTTVNGKGRVARIKR